MMQYSLLDRRPEESVLTLLQENNIGVLVRGSLAQGLLAGKTPKDYLGHTSAGVKKASEAVINRVTKDRTTTQTALRYVLQHPAVTAAVVGVSSLEQLEEVAGTIDSPALQSDEIKILQDSILAKIYTEHR
jgi:aryl-alcohol dehydrogenase-like predicted oxidoreductase